MLYKYSLVLILTWTLWSGHCCYPHFTNEKSEAESSSMGHAAGFQACAWNHFSVWSNKSSTYACFRYPTTGRQQPWYFLFQFFFFFKVLWPGTSLDLMLIRQSTHISWVTISPRSRTLRCQKTTNTTEQQMPCSKCECFRNQRRRKVPWK